MLTNLYKMVEVSVENAPSAIQEWADEEVLYMWHTVRHALTLEVEVDYDEIETGRVIKNATLQNVVYDKDIPNYVKAWAENTAKRLVKENKV